LNFKNEIYEYRNGKLGRKCESVSGEGEREYSYFDSSKEEMMANEKIRGNVLNFYCRFCSFPAHSPEVHRHHQAIVVSSAVREYKRS
jgi:hypothetical protein